MGLPIGGGTILVADLASLGPFTASYAFDGFIVVVAFAVSVLFWLTPPDHEFFSNKERRQA